MTRGRRLTTAALITVLLLALAPTVRSTTYQLYLPHIPHNATPPPCTCTANLYNCTDFNTQQKAQQCFDHCWALGVGDIHNYLAERDALAETTSPVFVTSTGNRLDRRFLRTHLHRLGERADIHGVHPHRFRHTFAIEYLRNRGDVYTLQAMLGHTTLDMVKRYLLLAQADLETAHATASPIDNWQL